MNALIKVMIGTALVSVSSLSMAKQITDIAGRTVTIPDNVQTMALAESRMVYSLSLLQDNPTKGVVAWRTDLIKNDIDTYNKLTAKFPKIKNIVSLGNPYTSDVSLEKIIQLNPDVYILNLGKYVKAQETGLIKKLNKAGIPTVVVDFRQHPTKNTVPSVQVLGKLLNKEKRAKKFVNYYNKQMDLVANRVATLKESEKPLVFIENAAGLFPDKCCKTYGNQNFGKYIELAGGKNWGSTVSSGFKLKVNPEAIFSNDFDVIIGTGANWKPSYKGAESVSLGYAANERQVQAELQNLAERKGWSKLRAVKNKRLYSIYHQFYNSPYHFITIQAFAKWNHPELFKDVDVEKNYREFHNEFLPIDYSGQFWAKLQ